MILLLAAALSSWTVPLPEGYDATVAPSLVACTSEPTRVHAEMHLTKVHTMDEKKETIKFDGEMSILLATSTDVEGPDEAVFSLNVHLGDAANVTE